MTTKTKGKTTPSLARDLQGVNRMIIDSRAGGSTTIQPNVVKSDNSKSKEASSNA